MPPKDYQPKPVEQVYGSGVTPEAAPDASSNDYTRGQIVDGFNMAHEHYWGGPKAYDEIEENDKHQSPMQRLEELQGDKGIEF